jgi:hypothetical protein
MKLFTGALVGAIIIFILQFLSWGVLNLHRPAQQYTPKQDEILSYLNTQFDSSGGYLMPTTPASASSKEMEQQQEQSKDKPWVQIFYHKSLNTNMGINMVKNLITNFIMVLLFCWILAGFTRNTFGKTFLASIFLGLIIFLHSSYTQYIWYEIFDLGAHFADYLISWGLTGIWLGWWLNRKKV